KDGSEVVGKTNAEFSRVVESSAKMSELIEEIAAASREQAQGIEQISRGISEMDRVVQKNAANAEESAAASEEMNAQAEQMKVYVEELETVIRGEGKGPAANGNGRKARAVRAAAPPKAGGQTLKKAQLPREVSPEKLIPFDEKELNDF
ncbi:MAG: methyl-accepting chemotaxis protein, partial [Desulfobacteraceae bacterium]|nr:methyl-accepting chemotaxis protein [Desulfobacteraceae bacterium]